MQRNFFLSFFLENGKIQGYIALILGVPNLNMYIYLESFGKRLRRRWSISSLPPSLGEAQSTASPRLRTRLPLPPPPHPPQSLTTPLPTTTATTASTRIRVRIVNVGADFWREGEFMWSLLFLQTETSTSPALSHVSTDMSIFSFNIQVWVNMLLSDHLTQMSTVQDLSENNTPMLTPVLTPRSSLSRSMLSFSFRSATSARPLSPLVTGTSTPMEERRESPGKKLRSEFHSWAYYNNRDHYCNFVFY